MSKGRHVPPLMTKISVTSGYGAQTKRPFVHIDIPGAGSIKISPDEARELAANLLQAAEGADSDGFLVEFLKHTAELNQEQTIMVLREFRQWRERQRQAEQERNTPPDAETA